jgi:signal peptidase I
MEETIEKKRNPFIAAFLSIICLGLGQFYNGQIKKAIFIYSGMILFVFGVSNVLDTFKGLIFYIILALLFAVGTIIDAVVTSIRKKNYKLKKINKPLYYFLYLMTIYSISLFSEPLVADALNFQNFYIPSGGMEDALIKGDYIMVNKGYYQNNKIKRGDIIIHIPEHDPENFYAQRCVAVENDHFSIKDGSIYINGTQQIEPYVKGKTYHGVSKIEGKVPKGRIIVLGDNRENSRDSRYLGYVSLEKVYAKAQYIYWNTNHLLFYENPFERIGKPLK